MAACDNHPETEAGLIIGNTQTGDQLYLCGPCGARFGLDLALEMLPPEEIAAVLGERFQPPQEAAAGNGKRRAKRSKEPASEPGTEPQPEAAEAMAAAAAAAPNEADSSV